jgi:uncharacterized protein (DUF433 family)
MMVRRRSVGDNLEHKGRIHDGGKSHRNQPSGMLGKPVIRGTRITVELILRKLSEGATESDLIDAHPRLTREDIRAAIAYAADTLANEETLSLESAG